MFKKRTTLFKKEQLQRAKRIKLKKLKANLQKVRLKFRMPRMNQKKEMLSMKLKMLKRKQRMKFKRRRLIRVFKLLTKQLRQKIRFSKRNLNFLEVQAVSTCGQQMKTVIKLPFLLLKKTYIILTIREYLEHTVLHLLKEKRHSFGGTMQTLTLLFLSTTRIM